MVLLALDDAQHQSPPVASELAKLKPQQQQLCGVLHAV